MPQNRWRIFPNMAAIDTPVWLATIDEPSGRQAALGQAGQQILQTTGNELDRDGR